MIGQLALASALATIAGCGEVDRFPIEGTVTLDGDPIENGQINFIPMNDTKGPTAGAPIIDGRYLIASEKGPMVGNFRVEVTAVKQTSGSKQSLNIATGKVEAVEVFKSIVPQRYNRDSELTANVKAGESNRFDFALKSDP